MKKETEKRRSGEAESRKGISKRLPPFFIIVTDAPRAQEHPHPQTQSGPR